jgi:hypothetical protein
MRMYWLLVLSSHAAYWYEYQYQQFARRIAERADVYPSSKRRRLGHVQAGACAHAIRTFCGEETRAPPPKTAPGSAIARPAARRCAPGAAGK